MFGFLRGFIAYTALCASALGATADDTRVLVIVLDGLRPDYVTEDLMPNLHALGERGVVFDDHHAVFPTVTRVNSASISTGSYPESHGLMGNSVYFPEIDPDRSLTTSDARNLARIEEATDGNLLTAPSMGERLNAAGKTILAVSSGSGGSATLLNHKAKGGGVINTSVIHPASQREQVLETLGPIPPDAAPNEGRNRWAVDAYLKIGLEDLKPALTFMWLSDPDHTAHEYGMGSVETTKALRLVDAEVGRIVDAHRSRGLQDTVNIMVASDHGFSTYAGGENLRSVLREVALDAVTAGGAIYLENNNDANIKRLVTALQAAPWVGSIYTRPDAPGALEGFAAGTLSFNAMRWNHERAGDVMVSADWSDDEAAPGFRGTTRKNGVAGHGTDSYFDVHATLIAAGPAFKRGVRSRAPTANVDIAPTVCRILGLAIPESMDGRVMDEAFVDGPAPADVTVEEDYSVVETQGYRLALSRSRVGEHVYLNWTRVDRP